MAADQRARRAGAPTSPIARTSVSHKRDDAGHGKVERQQIHDGDNRDARPHNKQHTKRDRQDGLSHHARPNRMQKRSHENLRFPFASIIERHRAARTLGRVTDCPQWAAAAKGRNIATFMRRLLTHGPISLARNDRIRQAHLPCSTIWQDALPQKASSLRRRSRSVRTTFPNSGISCHRTPSEKRRKRVTKGRGYCHLRHTSSGRVASRS